MRSGKVLLAVALTVSTGVACFSDDGPTQSNDATWQTPTRKYGFTFGPDGKRRGPEPKTLRRTAHGNEKQAAGLPVVNQKQGVIQAAAVNENQRVRQVAQEEAEVIDFGPLDDDGPFTAPAVPPGQGATPLAVPGKVDDLFAPADGKATPAQPAGNPRSLHQPPTAARPRSLSNGIVPVPPQPGSGTSSARLPVSTISSPPNFSGSMQAQPVSTLLDIATPNSTTSLGGPLVAVKVEREGTVSVGRECDCSFQVRNNGSGVAGNVILEAYVPKDVQITGTTPGTSERGVLTWTLGELQPGQEKTVRVSMVPKNSGALKVQSFVRYSGQNETTLTVVEPKLKVALAGPKDAKVGEATPYVITVSNPGSGVAENVVISARIPKGLEHRRGEHLTMQVGALSPGESRDVRLALTATDAGQHPIRVEVIADQGLNDSTDAAIAIVAPMLGLEINGPPVRHPGRRGNYTLLVSNPGNVAASNIRAKYRIPTGFEFVEADRGGRPSADGSIEWFVGQLAPGETSRLNLTLKAGKLGQFVHQAGVVSEQGATKSAELPTVVQGVASLAVTIQDRDDPVEVGQETLYEVRVANEGSKGAENVILTCEIPNGMQVTSVRGPVNYYHRNGQVVFEALKALPAGKSTIFQLVVTASSGGSKRLRARVVSDSVREPLTSEELTKVYAD